MPIFTPDTEPYLSLESVRNFDLHIVRAMQYYENFGLKTLSTDLSPLQAAACEIVPQGVSIALSIRELIRQAYLYSALILMRPLVERTGTINLLICKPDMLLHWHSGWPRKKQPSFDTLLKYAFPKATKEENEVTRNILHKLIHSDPSGSKFNLQSHSHSSLMTFASGKELNASHKTDAVCRVSTDCLKQLITASVGTFLYPDGSNA